jgi:hypothetical protein
MGIGFTADSPVKIAHYGIDSVIAINDDLLLEKLRKKFCEDYSLSYSEIKSTHPDARAERVKEYLNVAHEIVSQKHERLVNGDPDFKELNKYIEMLPEDSKLREEYSVFLQGNPSSDKMVIWAKEKLQPGKIDVNIMTKLDKANFKGKEALPQEFNDAHAALRGFALSSLDASLVLSAGLNPRLYGYMESFEDFYPQKSGFIKKRIILKVSDYRSALIQGKYLAKKGLWVSEYRIESGLNCGGHAFATEGLLLGPILEEFKVNRDELYQANYELIQQSFEEKNISIEDNSLELKISVQGGVGTAQEHNFLMSNYNVDSIGWGTPFLLVPEATSVDKDTLEKLKMAKEEDLYLSDVSPLGVSFNTLRDSSKDIEKMQRVKAGKPGSPCVKKHLALFSEFGIDDICTASSRYQKLKIKELDDLVLDRSEYEKRYKKIVEKECLCTGLGVSVLEINGIDHKFEGDAVSICPGPNMAYFSRELSLREMINHVYGRTNEIERSDRPNMFVKELNLYLDLFVERLKNMGSEISKKQIRNFNNYEDNIREGITYYLDLFKNKFPLEDVKKDALQGMKAGLNRLNEITSPLNYLLKPSA